MAKQGTKPSKDDPFPSPDDLPFESALSEVESIIERIEAGEVGLEESLSAYERGIQLIVHCRGKLDQAQLRVIDLTKKLSDADKKSDRETPED